ncbi:PREDICTED: basic proline-rich protein-like [Chinchilla lanigera]|uniref:basic proline-rich protein-like n=1 Tax=Chinchilla lanigera TaxID=34839 RepID=UPI0006987FAE|nr:PREDICTED: basic proline-rich protein-like [Chinchilla lanigera]
MPAPGPARGGGGRARGSERPHSSSFCPEHGTVPRGVRPLWDAAREQDPGPRPSHLGHPGPGRSGASVACGLDQGFGGDEPRASPGLAGAPATPTCRPRLAPSAPPRLPCAAGSRPCPTSVAAGPSASCPTPGLTSPGPEFKGRNSASLSLSFLYWRIKLKFRAEQSRQRRTDRCAFPTTDGLSQKVTGCCISFTQIHSFSQHIFLGPS